MARVTEGPLMGRLSGRVGNAVFVNTSSGTVVRDRPITNDPGTPAQLLNRAWQAKAARTWSLLDPEVVARWAVYGKAVGMRPMNVFTTLYKRLLTLDPSAPPPLFPPARPFFGDTIYVDCGGSTPLSQRAEHVSTPSTGQSGAESPQSITFSASAPNTAGIVTELFIQPLASRHRRTYLERYRHAAFTAFAGGTQVVGVRGLQWYACAYRFVNASTGQATAIAELGIVRVDL